MKLILSQSSMLVLLSMVFHRNITGNLWYMQQLNQLELE